MGPKQKAQLPLPVRPEDDSLLGGALDETPVNADGLVQDLGAVEGVDGRLRLLERLVLHQGVTLCASTGSA